MSQQTTPTTVTTTSTPGTLSLTDVVAQSVGFLGPVFSVSVLLPMLVGITTATGKGAGAAAPLAVLIGTVGMLGVGWIVSAYARRIHAAGSLYNYVTEGLGPRLGVAAGYVYYLGVLVLGAAIAVLIGGVLYDNLKNEFGFDAVPAWGWQAVYIGVSVSVTRGIRTMARDGWLPRPLARVSARRGTPVGGTVVVGAAYLLTVVGGGAFPTAVAIPGLPNYFGWYAWLSAFGIFCLAAIYLAMCVGAPRGLRGDAAPAKVWTATVVGVVITGGALFGALYKVPSPTIWAAWAAIGCVFLSSVACFVITPQRTVAR